MSRGSLRNAILVWLIISFSQLLTLTSHASIQIPTNLSKKDREQILSILGLGTSSKLLSDPYPLGGYVGLEAGFGLETFPAEEIGRLGRGVRPPQQDATLPKISVGKGLFNNLDVFVQFTPYTKQDEVAEYGGIVRWGFYQATFLPLSLSVLAHATHANIGNQIITRSYGFDLIGGMNVDNVALFAGLGPIESSGTFLGGGSSTSITDSGGLENEFITGFHTLFGANIHFENYFLSLQIDRYTTAVYSAKLGVRF